MATFRCFSRPHRLPAKAAKLPSRHHPVPTNVCMGVLQLLPVCRLRPFSTGSTEIRDCDYRRTYLRRLSDARRTICASMSGCRSENEFCAACGGGAQSAHRPKGQKGAAGAVPSSFYRFVITLSIKPYSMASCADI